MKCPYCLGTSFQRGRFDLAQVVNLQPVVVRNVPAQKCKQCGYLQVTAATMKKVEERLGAGLPDTVVPTSVYDLQTSARPAASGGTTPLLVGTGTTRVAV